MSQAEVRILESVDAGGSGLRVEFFRAGRRWAHRVLGVEVGESVALLESVEGDDRQSCPPSPALQQLALEQRDTGQDVVFLIGMAGKNHWSVCVEVVPATRAVRFDVACRSQTRSVGQLGSTYATRTPWRMAPGAAYVMAAAGANEYVLTPQRVGSPAALPTMRMDTGEIMISPSVIADAPTQRWCYELRQSTVRP